MEKITSGMQVLDCETSEILVISEIYIEMNEDSNDVGNAIWAYTPVVAFKGRVARMKVSDFIKKIRLGYLLLQD